MTVPTMSIALIVLSHPIASTIMATIATSLGIYLAHKRSARQLQHDMHQALVGQLPIDRRFLWVQRLYPKTHVSTI